MIYFRKEYSVDKQQWTAMLFVISFLGIFHAAKSTMIVNIGAMFSTTNLTTLFQEHLADVNKNLSSSNISVSLRAVTFPMSENPIRSSLDACENILSEQVHLLIVDQGNCSSDAVVAISYTCGFYHVPTIGIGSRDAMFSDKTIHPSFLRTISPFDEQAKIWIKILKHFNWNKIMTITSNDYESKSLHAKFFALAEAAGIQLEKSIQFMPGTLNLTYQLQTFSKSVSRVFLLLSNGEDAKTVYRDASNLLFTGKGYVWIVAEQALFNKKPNLQQTPLGSISCRLIQASDEQSHLRDAIQVVSLALQSLYREGNLKNMTLVDGCHSTTPWSEGKAMYNKLLNTTITNGLTGDVVFDSVGDRVFESYKIVNVRETGIEEVGYFRHNNLSLNRKIIWPGGSNDAPEGIFISKHLRVVTLVESPFVYADKLPESGNCSALNSKHKTYVSCFGRLFGVPEDNAEVHCCSGFCMDLLNLLATKINFTYSVHLAEDGNFGSYVKEPGMTKRGWNGMVGEILEGESDLIVASLTINNERAKVIDFSKPFKYQGITILVKKSLSPSSLDSFLRPFQIELWLLVLLSVHVVAVILYLLDRFSPFGRFNLAKSDKDETPLNLSSAMWFSWGVLLNSGIGEGTPRSFSARVLGMVWAGFAMIIVASYTANLAAFLVLDRPKAVVTGIDDPNLRNPSDSFKYATVANSSVDDYFRRQVELSSMHTFMDHHGVASAQEGIDAVRSGYLKAFIWDSPVLYHESSKDCSLTTAGELFGRSGYGVGLPKGSIWTNDISLAILNFHESGKMEELETLWIDIGNCPEISNAPATLGLSHMLGVFIMVIAGIGAGIIIIVLEIVYHKHRGWREDQRELAKKTTDVWKNNVIMTKNARNSNIESNGTVLKQNGNEIRQTSRINPIYVGD